MINYVYDEDNNIASLKTRGNVIDIAAEIGILVGRVFDAFNEKHPEAGAAFKDTILITVSEDSPIWNKLSGGVLIVIKFVVDKGEVKAFEISGGLFQISAEMAILPKLIYQEVSKINTEEADIFKDITQTGMKRNDSPVWDNSQPFRLAGKVIRIDLSGGGDLN